MDRVDVDKYSVIIGGDNGKFIFKALRNGEKWIDNLSNVEGSNLILTMAYEIQALREQLAQMKQLKGELKL